ncbi:MAG: homoserine kinase [Candidatus Bathyarchaeia archaeon]
MNPRSRGVRVEAPCSTANLGPGFDVLGLALDAYRDLVEVSLERGHGVSTIVKGPYAKDLSEPPEGNAVTIVAEKVLRESGFEGGVRIELTKNIPVGKGLGSSGASSAACALALNILLDLGWNYAKLIQLAMEGEYAASGARHADNVSASLLGGLTLIGSYNPLEVVKLVPSEDLRFVVAFPWEAPSRRKTEASRAAAPRSITLRDHVSDLGCLALLVTGIIHSDLELIGKAMGKGVVEKARIPLIPGYHKVREAAYKAGAYGISISGAGPALVALTGEEATGVAEAVRKAYREQGFTPEVRVARPAHGARILPEEGDEP